jgi:PKD repeat protein
VRVFDVLTVGHVGGGLGWVAMYVNALLATDGTYISPNGVIAGTGTLSVHFSGLQNDGTLSPTINVVYPLTGTSSRIAGQAAAGAATLTVDGALTMGASGRLEIPLTGPQPGEYGSLGVTATAALDGVLALDFQRGYAPRQGDTFTLLTAGEGTTGAFASVEISGLRPGFELEITYVDGQVALVALNDGVPDDFVAAGFTWAAAGLDVCFTNTTIGTEPISYAWDFGDGGASTEVSPAHSYAEPGVYTATLTATNVAGSDTRSHDVEVGLEPELDELYLVAAAANAAGAAGSFFVTDLEVNNAGTEAMSYQLWWLPRDADNSIPAESEVFTLAAGASVRYENVLGEVFAAVDAVGALAVATDSADAVVMSRTFNRSDDGTFGQGLPGIPSDQLIASGQVERIIFMSENDDIRANLGCVNGLDTPVRIDIELYDGAGAMLETRAMDLAPYSNSQVNRIFRSHAPVNGYVDVSTRTAGAAFTCYGSVLDNSTSDPTTVLPQAPSDATTFVPAAALAAGLEGAFFSTDLDLNNAGQTSVEYRLGWLPRGADNSAATMSAAFTLAGGASVRYDNVLDSVFGLEPDEVGALVVVADSDDLLAMSRTYNLPSAKVAGTFGQELPGIPAGGMIPAGEKMRIIFMNENDDVRSNVGCQNAGLDPATVTIELHSSDGELLGTRTMTLPPRSNDQLNRLFRSYAPIEAGYVDVWTDSPGASIYCYGSVLDNRTSDPTTVVPR